MRTGSRPVPDRPRGAAVTPTGRPVDPRDHRWFHDQRPAVPRTAADPRRHRPVPSSAGRPRQTPSSAAVPPAPEETDVHCTRCGHDNPEGSRFCAQCGAALSQERVGESTSVIPKVGGEDTGDVPEAAEPSADAHAGAVESLPAGSALLVVKRGPNAGSRFLLDQDVTTAGRHPDSDIFLDDVTVSRRHVEFHREGGGFSVHDVGSLNGTYVNREPVDVATLAGGDEVQIGKFRLVYLTGPRTGEHATR
nr:FHA domain-containing protein [Geodermatophilus normandii]